MSRSNTDAGTVATIPGNLIRLSVLPQVIGNGEASKDAIARSYEGGEAPFRSLLGVGDEALRSSEPVYDDPSKEMPVTDPIESELLLPIGEECVRTERTDTIRLPYNGTAVSEVAQGTPELVSRASRAARPAAGVMEKWSNYQRAELLDHMADVLRRDHAAFARAITHETGKPITEARAEVDRGYRTLLASSIAARSLHGQVVPLDGAPLGAGRMALTVRQPVGVVGIIIPFNVPLNLTFHKLGPALARMPSDA